MAVALINPGFEDGNLTGWDATAGIVVNSSPHVFSGTYAAHIPDGTTGIYELVQTTRQPAYQGLAFTAAGYYEQGSAPNGQNVGNIFARWYDEDGNVVGVQNGNFVTSSQNGPDWKSSTVNATYIPGAVEVAIGWYVNKGNPASVHIDQFTWNYPDLPVIDLTYPIAGSTYEAGTEVPFRVEITTGMTVQSVTYRATNTATTAVTEIGPVTTAPWGTNYSTLPAANYSVIARVTFTNGYVVDSDAHLFTVGAAPPPDTREFKASNSYTNLVAKNFVGLASVIPPTAQVVGMQTVVDYYIEALIRSKDLDVADVTVARYDAAFEMVPSVTFETVLLQDDGTSYTALGGNATAEEAVLRSDFSVTEDGTSEGKRWTVLEGDPQQVTIGQTDDLFGMDPMTASEFITRALGLRFYPNLAPKPDYADSGDACFRVNLDKLRVQIYFDAGSVEYYFVSPDGTQVIKGRLAAAYVDSGAFANGDASGVMQLASDLEIVLGDSRTILGGWSIHSAFPSTEGNKIGDVSADMTYNGLPTYGEVTANRSRYQFISANFYGDLSYDSIYGVNGVDRSFSYNGDFFYKIHTQADLEKDKPRHVEFYHTHLALGYGEGRVDVSVVGEPYNFNGVDGASSWAIGDSVTGLLNLSGTMLGIFCRKSIHALAGTTVDNFATQVLSPKIGAVEYTITDMGFPVYANAYGIYTLAQTNQYGDYLGTPMSQDVSPWLRPRLVRKYTSPREVVVAWPVRSKNQYRLSFADGYVLTMTINNGQQSAPTFSQQKYFIADPDAEYSLYEAPSIVPAAVSSELDDGGQERIHIANMSEYRSEEVEGPSIEGQGPDAVLYAPYSFSYTVTPGDAPIRRTAIISGSLLSGLEWDEDTATISGTPQAVGTMTLTLRTYDENGLYADHDDVIRVVEEHFLLVTGATKGGTGNPVFAYALALDPLEFTGINQSTGADLLSGSAAWWEDKWTVASVAGAVSSSSPNGMWSGGTLTPANAVGPIVGGDDGWVTIRQNEEVASVYTADVTPSAFTQPSITSTLTNGDAGDAQASSILFKEGGDYFLCRGKAFRALYSSPVKDGPYEAVWDLYKEQAAGRDPNGAHISYWYDKQQFNDEWYAIIGWHFDEAFQRYKIIKGPSRDNWNTFEVLVDVPAASAAERPVQFSVNEHAIVAYTNGGRLWTSANDWEESIATGLSQTAGSSNNAVALFGGRRIDTANGMFYCIGNTDTLVVFDPQTMQVSTPVVLPIGSTVSISATTLTT